MLAGTKRYRSKVEVLRDLIEAAMLEVRKSRIIERANLNEESFSRYSGMAVEHGLLGRSPAGYRTTVRGLEWLNAANLVLAKCSELFAALQDLNSLTSSVSQKSSADSGPGTPRFLPPPVRSRTQESEGRVPGMVLRMEPTRWALGLLTADARFLDTEGSERKSLDPRIVSAPRRKTPAVGVADPVVVGPDDDADKSSSRLWPSLPSFPLLPWLATLGAALASLAIGIPLDAGLSG